MISDGSYLKALGIAGVAAILLTLLWTLVPREIVLVPKTRVRIQDGTGRGIPGVAVFEHFGHYSVDENLRTDTQFTDELGEAKFERKVVSLSRLGAFFGAVRTFFRTGFHSSFGVHSWMIVGTGKAGLGSFPSSVTWPSRDEVLYVYVVE